MHHRLITRLSLVALMLAFFAGVRTVAAETVSLEWDPNPEANIVGYRVFIGAQPGVYDSQVDVGNVTRYPVGTLQPGRRYCFAVAAFAAGPVLGSKSVEVCTDTNQPPTLQDPGSQAGQVGVAVTLQLVGADPESSPVIYSATGLPAGITINPNTGFLSGTPTTVGTFNVQATISDGTLSTTQAFTWTVGAALPGVTTLLRPTGTVASDKPTFEWESLATATSYRLWVDDASATNPKVQIDYTPAQAGCSTAGAVCQATPGIALAIGSASWSIQVSNASGAGPWSGAMDFMVPDTKVPLVAIATPTANTTFSTANIAIAMAGTASDDQAVTQVTWTNNRGGSGTATGTTSWGISEVPLFVGVNIVTITARDAAGNTATDVLTVTRTDSAPPTLTITSPAAGATHATSQTVMSLAGTASDNVAVTSVTWATDRGAQGTATGTTNWSVGNLPLSSGTNVITVTAVDAAGNRSTATLTATADTVAPTVSVTAPTTAATLTSGAATLALAGTASDDVSVTEVTWATDQGASGVAAGTTSWSVSSVPLTAAVTVITVTAKDAAGRSSTDVLTVTRPDTTAPTVDITAPSALATLSTTSETIALGGTASDNVGVTLVTWSNSTGGGGTVAGTTSWSVASVALKPGANVITVTARDEAGNVATDSVTVTVTDVTAPVVTITTPAASTLSTNAASIALAGTSSDVFGVTEVRWANNRGGSGVATGTTGWSVPAVALQLGANVITVTARDAAGNTATGSITVASDRTAPVVAITAPSKTGSFVATSDTVTLDGTAGDDIGVTEVTWVNSRGGSGQVPGAASWRALVPVVGGVNVITVTARDAAGNQTSTTISVTRDGQAPSIVIVAPDASGPVWTSAVYVALRGTANDDAGVTKVTWRSSFGAQGVAQGTSDWTIPSVGLYTGANVITVTALDAAGNTTSATRTFMLDRTPPAVSITAPTTTGKLVTTDNAIAVLGTVTDAGEVAEVSWTNSQGGAGVASGTTAWSVLQMALRPGPNTLTFTARDKAGNVGTRILGVTVTDVKAPSVRILTPASGQEHSTAVGVINLQGTALDDFGPARVTWVNDRGGSGVAAGDTAWTVAGLALQPGVNVITVTAQDPTGNTQTDSVRVTLESGAPAMALMSPTPAVGSKSASPNVAVTNSSSSTSSPTPKAPPADATAPVVKIFAPTTAATFVTLATTVTVGGTATDAAGVTQVSWTNSRGGGGEAFGTGGWGVPGIPLAPGENVITVTVRDAAGNKGTAVLKVTSNPTTSQLSASASTAQVTR